MIRGSINYNTDLYIREKSDIKKKIEKAKR